MDINLIRTFLELNRTRHFGQAADNLCITQSAVSARIRLLEETVSVPLFTRERNNINLTSAGTKFLRYADSILNTWARACQDIAIEDPGQTLLTIGGTPSLWDIFLQDWLNGLTRDFTNLSFSAEAHHSEVLLRKLLDRTLDLIVGFESIQMSELDVIEIKPVKFVLVTTDPQLSIDEAITGNYVYVDWGTFFGIKHAQHFPDIKPGRLRVQLGRLALNHILQCGGSAYLAESMIEPNLKNKSLFIIQDAPIISRMTYVVCFPDSDKSELIGQLVDKLKIS